MRLVHDHEVPVDSLHLRLEVEVTGQLIQTSDPKRLFRKGVTAARGLDLLVGQDAEVDVELLPELILPLLDEAAGNHDQTTLNVAPDHQLFEEQARHDRLAGARVVSEQKA